ncbi:hypothetical protein HY643_02050 [Candidatus Woesearchaeota archaeon]|nr:hypothetical protein [Candidatus Woesearchaeota archaeon]
MKSLTKIVALGLASTFGLAGLTNCQSGPVQGEQKFEPINTTVVALKADTNLYAGKLVRVANGTPISLSCVSSDGTICTVLLKEDDAVLRVYLDISRERYKCSSGVIAAVNAAYQQQTKIEVVGTYLATKDGLHDFKPEELKALGLDFRGLCE